MLDRGLRKSLQSYVPPARGLFRRIYKINKKSNIASASIIGFWEDVGTYLLRDCMLSTYPMFFIRVSERFNRGLITDNRSSHNKLIIKITVNRSKKEYHVYVLEICISRQHFNWCIYWYWSHKKSSFLICHTNVDSPVHCCCTYRTMKPCLRAFFTNFL